MICSCKIRTVGTIFPQCIPTVVPEIILNSIIQDHFCSQRKRSDISKICQCDEKQRQIEMQAQRQKEIKMDKKDNVVPTRSNRCEYYQYGQVLQTSLSQAPPQVPYHIYDDTQDRKVFTVTRCSRSDVVFD